MAIISSTAAELLPAELLADLAAELAELGAPGLLDQPAGGAALAVLLASLGGPHADLATATPSGTHAAAETLLAALGGLLARRDRCVR